MAFDLLSMGTDENFRVSMRGWALLLALARDHGWVPAGTANEPYGPTWDGCYESSNGQVVSAEDAAALAAALERAAAGNAYFHQYKPVVPRCAAFCRRGAFAIL